jgi:Tfp pilus assembly protein PilZ
VGTDDESSERRRAERIPINEELSRDGSTWVSDLSIGGVFVHTAAMQPVGALIELSFTVLLDDPVVLQAVGKVVRHSRKPPGMGVQFVAMQPEMAERIEEVLERQQPIDSGAPLRLPEPRPDDDDDEPTRLRLARPAPIGDLAVTPTDEDAVTSTFPRLAKDGEPPTTLFRPPPLPGEAGTADAGDDDPTRQYPALRRED